MIHPYLNNRPYRFCGFLLFAFLISLFFPLSAFAKYPLLEKLIIDLNERAHEESLKDESYRGEEGILHMLPEKALSFGLKVHMDEDYKEGRTFLEKAEKALEAARELLSNKKKERLPGEFAQGIFEQMVNFKRASDLGKKRLARYHSRLTTHADERLNREISLRVMKMLLAKSFDKTGNNLRDGLGHFYNLCHEPNPVDEHLTPDNILFVNTLFKQYNSRAGVAARKGFDLDRISEKPAGELSGNWKHALDKKGAPYISFIETVIKKERNRFYPVDPLLLAALMKRESGFNPLAVSPVGAAGLLQIMPETAKKLGMKRIYHPGYFNDAFSLLKKERRHRRQALERLFEISGKGGLELAKKARSLMQKSLALAQKKEKLFKRYKKELLRQRNDDRLKPSKAIAYGYKYLSKLMRDQSGDMSLALASYNAGAHRVKQYNGIPPYKETVHFRNMVLHYYREYLKKAETK